MWQGQVIPVICITIILVIALIMHLDGNILIAGITAIAGLGGFTLGKASNP